jgi:hypothetical protein
VVGRRRSLVLPRGWRQSPTSIKRTDGRGRQEIRQALDGIQQPMDASADGPTSYTTTQSRDDPRRLAAAARARGTAPAVPGHHRRRTGCARLADSRWWPSCRRSPAGRVYVAPIDDPDARRRCRSMEA